MKKLIARLLHENEAATAIEYAIIAAVIGIAAIGAYAAVGTQINAKMEQAAGEIEGGGR